MIEKVIDPIKVYEFISKENEFKEIEKKIPLHAHLDSNKIILFVDLKRRRVWLWCGSKITSYMESLAIRSLKNHFFKVSSTYYEGIRFTELPNIMNLEKMTRIIHEGKEPTDFKKIVMLLEFKVNDFLTLKLEEDKTFTYIKGKKFIQCMRLFLQIPPEKSNLYEEVESIDEATEIFNKYLLENRIVKGKFSKSVRDFHNTITPRQEFWGHCSNIQVWAENEYDTRLLHSNLSFPLLKALSEAGDQIALRKFREEIAVRLEGGYFPVILYLFKENYLQYLPSDYLYDLRKKISGTLIPYIFKILKRESFGSYMINPAEGELRQRSPSEYSKLRRLKDLLYLPHIVNQMNPKEFIIGISSLDFTFLDFFLSPNIENKEFYFETLLDRLLYGLRSKDSLFQKATKHFIERIIKYFFDYIFPSKEGFNSHKHKETDVCKSNIISIIWLLEKIYENKWENIIIQNITYLTSFSESKNYIKTQLDLIEDVTSFRNFLTCLLENKESKKNSH